jgi:transposase InsO family protein
VNTNLRGRDERAACEVWRDISVARMRKRVRSTTMSDHEQPVAGNVLDRQVEADRPNQRWVGDTTEFVIGGTAKLYWLPSSTSTPGLSWAGP